MYKNVSKALRFQKPQYVSSWEQIYWKQISDQENRNENLAWSFSPWKHSGAEANDDGTSTVSKLFNKQNSGYARAI